MLYKVVKNSWIIAMLMPLLMAAPAWAADGAHGDKAVAFNFGNIGQAVASLLIFAILLIILGKWAWKPIIAQLEAREKKIADTIAHAQQRQEDAQRMLEQYQARLATAEAQSEALMAESRKQANTAREKILQQAAQEAHRTAEQIRQEIESAKQETLRELYDYTATLATEIASKIIRRNLRPEDQKQIIEESFQEFRNKVKR